MTVIEFLNVLFENFNEGNYLLLLMLLIIFFTKWSYNEFRKNFLKIQEQNNIDIGKALEQYYNLHSKIIAFQLKKISSTDVLNCFNQTIVYLPRSIVKEILKLDELNLESESLKLQNIKILISDEIIRIKYNQSSITTFDYKDDIFKQFSRFFHNNGFASLVYPLVYSFFSLVVIFFLVVFFTGANNFSGIPKIFFFLFIYNFIISLMILAYLIDLSFKKMIKNKVYIFFILLIVLPALLIALYFSVNFSILHSISIIYFFFIVHKKKLLQQNTN